MSGLDVSGPRGGGNVLGPRGGGRRLTARKNVAARLRPPPNPLSICVLNYIER
jgi:hypothetical protein